MNINVLNRMTKVVLPGMLQRYDGYLEKNLCFLFVCGHDLFAKFI